MHRLLILGVLGLLACGLGRSFLSHDDPDVTVTDGRRSDPTVIDGVVRNEKTGDLVAGARVVLWCDCSFGSPEVITAADGAFRFEDMPRGYYRVGVYYQDDHLAKGIEARPGRRVTIQFRTDPDRPPIRLG